ncbi:shaggy-related protein kinase theta-like [Zingiber officinale]|uniref:shaggy-related protein kinase theta-like n=1 Tax=Zingiber officinale TaxID=94328 RepID=UPI001C4B2E3D|nr:shaggy-related protein kinase theta-like [Zingiber officinale]
MNLNYSEFKFPCMKGHPWHKFFANSVPPEVIDLVSTLLQYSPNLCLTSLEACSHPFFDELRDPNTCLLSGKPLPPLFNFTSKELESASPKLVRRLLPEH